MQTGRAHAQVGTLHLIVLGALSKTSVEVTNVEEDNDGNEEVREEVENIAGSEDDEEQWIENLAIEVEAIAFLKQEMVDIESKRLQVL